MNLYWPEESTDKAPPSQSSEVDFHYISELLRSILTSEANAFLTNRLSEEVDRSTNFEALKSATFELLEETGSPELINFHIEILVLHCAHYLRRNPTPDGWQKIQNLSYNSWELEHWILDAITAVVAEDPGAAGNYISLAEAVLHGADRLAIHPRSQRRIETAKSLLAHWGERGDKLDELWSGLHNTYETGYHDFYPLAKLLFLNDPSRFSTLVGELTNPYLARICLDSAGAATSFSTWRVISKLIPDSFNSDGAWRGTAAYPLMLSIAYSNLYSGAYTRKNRTKNAILSKEIREIVSRLSEEIVSIAASRPDWPGALTRWSTWLMRQNWIFGSDGPHEENVAQLICGSLISSICQNLPKEQLVTEVPPEARAWEVWTYLAVRGMFSRATDIPYPNADDFLGAWMIPTDQWKSPAGDRFRSLLEAAPATKAIPSLAAESLSLMFTASEQSISAWLRLIDDTPRLRELIEFGDPDESDTYSSSTRSSFDGLKLQFEIGLAIFDEIVWGRQSTNESGSTRAETSKLVFLKLWEFVSEMIEIDSALHRDYWFDAYRQLAARRILCEHSTADNNLPPIFNDVDTPTYAQFLNGVRGDVISLARVIDASARATPDIGTLVRKLSDEGIRIGDISSQLLRLNGVDPRRYPLTLGSLPGLSRLNSAATPT